MNIGPKRAKVSDADMIVHYLTEYRRKTVLTRSSSLPIGQVHGFEARACTVIQDPSTGVYTITSSVSFGDLLTDSERQQARYSFLQIPLGMVFVFFLRGGGGIFGLLVNSWLAVILWGLTGVLFAGAARDKKLLYAASVLAAGGLLVGPVLHIGQIFPGK